MTDDSQDADESEQFDDLDEEFSLDKLSKAYAEVIRQRSADGDQPNPEEDFGDETKAASAKAKKPSSPLEKKAKNKLASKPTSSEADDNRGCPIEPETIIESIVFVGAPRGESLTLAVIAKVLRDVSATDVRQSAEDLNEKYQKDNSAWRIEIEGDGDDAEIKMVLAENLAEFQNHYFGRNKEVQLSQATIDVLAVVAYHQPVSKLEIESTRGKPSGSVQDLPQSHDVSEFEEYID